MSVGRLLRWSNPNIRVILSDDVMTIEPCSGSLESLFVWIATIIQVHPHVLGWLHYSARKQRASNAL